MCAAFAAKQNAALIINGKTVDDRGTTYTGTDLDRNAVEKANIDREKAAMKLDLFYIDIYMEQFGCTRLNRNGTIVDQGLICRR